MGVLDKALKIAVTLLIVSSCAVSNTQDYKVGSKESIRRDQVSERRDSYDNAESLDGVEEEASNVNAESYLDTADNDSESTNNEEVALNEDSEVMEENSSTSKNSIKDIQLTAVELNKTPQTSGRVTLKLNTESAFELKKTALSEYTLTLPSVTSVESARGPQIAPGGTPGIRSTRVVQDGKDTLIRMFVDPKVTLVAKPQKNQILVFTTKDTIANAETDTTARGQLAKPDQEGGSQFTTVTNSNATPGADNMSADGAKVYKGKLISLDLNETDIDNALRIIAEVSNLNIIASEDVKGKVTLRLIDVPWDQALDVILKTNGLDQVTEGNVIRIAPIDKLKAEREALKDSMKAAENLEALKVKYIRVSYAKVAEMKEQIESVLSERGSVVVDERTNQLIVKDIAKGLLSAEDLVTRLDLRTPQVLLETQIVEASRSLLRDLGFQWNFNYVRSPQFGNSTGRTFPNTIGIGGGDLSSSGITSGIGGVGPESAFSFPANVSATSGSAITAVLDSVDGSRQLAARLTSLEQEGKVQVVSRPQVATVNNKEAEIKSVETVRIRIPQGGNNIGIGQGATAGNGGGGRGNAFQELEVGITLKVTPQASPDYYVLLDMFAKSSTFGPRIVDLIPSTIDRTATSTILIKSGQTFALGGVYRMFDKDNLDGVPFLKDVPFLGWLFRRSFFDKSDEELIFFITPHIVEGSFDESLMDETISSEGLDPLERKPLQGNINESDIKPTQGTPAQSKPVQAKL